MDDNSVKSIVKQAERPSLKLVPGDPSTIVELSSQLGKMETIGRALREKIQAEKMALLQEHDRKWSETQHLYARKIHDAVVQLEQERDAMLGQLKDDYFEKKRDLEKVELRLGE